MHRYLLTLLLCCILPVAQADFVQDRDLISLHYDHAPDKDDGHATVAALAIVRSLGIQPLVVSGAYGRNANQYQPGAEAVMTAAWGSGWLDAHNNRSATVNATYAAWLATLQNGGDIWIAEGGQADFTADVLRLLANNNPSINTRQRVNVIQHSVWNEAQSTQSDLNYSRDNTNYVKIADGNGDNQTADLNQKSASFVNIATNSQYGSAWQAAFNYLNPNNKLDFSDTVELLHILGVGKNVVATVDDFAAVYLSQNNVAQPNSPTVWSDSYSVDGQCYCDSNFDHGLSSITVDTPDGVKSVPQVCSDITSRFGSGRFNNRVYYNTIQCGHGPANNAADESVCPGIPLAAGNYTGNRCQQTGATWNLDLVYPAQTTQPAPVDSAPVDEPVDQPQSIVQPVTAPNPVVESETSIITHPDCSSAALDADGDGFGWENNQTCMVVAEAAPVSGNTTDATTFDPLNPFANFPLCTASNDDDGDGFGWENNQTCVFTHSAATPADNAPTPDTPTPDPLNPFANFPLCSATSLDSDGDGFGWENNQTCVYTTEPAVSTVTSATQDPLDPFANFPACSTNSSDTDGDGFGWEFNRTCVFTSSTSAVPNQSAAPAATPTAIPDELNPFANFPSCSGNITDTDGDGFGWEFNQTCVFTTSINNPVAPMSSAAPDALNPFANFPSCSGNITDTDGDGFGWEFNQTCVFTTSINNPAAPMSSAVPDALNPFANFPLCTDNSVDTDGDGFGWENFQTCVFRTQ